MLLWLMPSRFFLGSILVTIGCTAMLALHAAFGVPVQGFFFDGNWFMFAAGMVVYYVLTYATARRRLAAACLSAGGAAVWLWYDVRLGAAVAFAGLLLALHAFDRRLLASPCRGGSGRGAARCATASTWFIRFR